MKVGQLRTIGEDKRVYLVLEMFNEKTSVFLWKTYIKIFFLDTKAITIWDIQDTLEDPLLENDSSYDSESI